MTTAGRGEVLVGIDLGTTAVKVGLFEAEGGKAVAVVREEYMLSSLASGWMELEVRTYWEATVAATRKALGEAGWPRVLGIGLSSQGQTFVPLDGRHRPLRPAIVWLDTRAEKQAGYLRRVFDADDYQRHTWLPFPSAVDSASKMLWLRENEPEVWRRTRYLMLLPDYFGFRLTGERRLDVNNAQSTGLMDAAGGYWWAEGLEAVGIPEGWMSPIGRPGERIGLLWREAAEELGISVGIPVALGSNDQLSGAVGVANVRPGVASGTVGTAMAIASTVEEVAAGTPRGVLRGPHPVQGLFFLLSYAKTSGVLLTWLRELTGGEVGYGELLAEAEQVPAGSDGLICLPHFSGTGTPTFRSEVRGAFLGVSLAHRRAQFVRAVAEAVCFVAKDALSLTEQAGEAVRELRTVGGATQSEFWMQMLSDVVRLPLEIPECGEAAVLGAAVFAGMGAGRFRCIEEGSRVFYRPATTFLPREEAAAEYDEAYRAYREAMERIYPGVLGF